MALWNILLLVIMQSILVQTFLKYVLRADSPYVFTHKFRSGSVKNVYFICFAFIFNIWIDILPVSMHCCKHFHWIIKTFPRQHFRKWSKILYPSINLSIKYTIEVNIKLKTNWQKHLLNHEKALFYAFLDFNSLNRSHDYKAWQSRGP